MIYLLIALGLVIGAMLGVAIVSILADSKARDRCHECRTAERMSMKDN